MAPTSALTVSGYVITATMRMRWSPWLLLSGSDLRSMYTRSVVASSASSKSTFLSTYHLSTLSVRTPVSDVVSTKRTGSCPLCSNAATRTQPRKRSPLETFGRFRRCCSLK
jgi:hypothetical protein